MAARRNTKQPRRTPAAATSKPVPGKTPAAPVQSQAAETAAEALLADARTKADAIIAEALDDASGKVRDANAQGVEFRAEAERAAEQLRRDAADEADQIISSARAEADRLRIDAEGQAADRQAQAELAAQRTEKAAQARAEQIRETAVADAQQVADEARTRYTQTLDKSLAESGRIIQQAKDEAARLLADARQAADRLTADANRYAEARLEQAVTNAKELQQQAVTDVAAGRQFREESEVLRSAAAELHAAAEQTLADASTRTTRRLHRKKLKAEAKQARKEARPAKPNAVKLSVTHRALIVLIILGAAVIAAIGFTGSYGAVRDLAREKGFGDFAEVLPIGVDAGIGVLLALDLLMTYLRMPLPMLRHAAWILTGATVWFNAAASWPDPIGVGLHMAMPVLFVIVVEAARHAIGRLAEIEAKEHTQTPKLIRWALAFRSTSRLWRRQHVWTVRDLNQAIEDEGQRLVYIRQLQAKYKTRRARTRKDTGWRQQATEIELMPLDLYDTGVAFQDALRRAREAAKLSRQEQRQEATELPTTLTDSSASDDNNARQKSSSDADNSRQPPAKKPSTGGRKTTAKRRQKTASAKAPRRSMTEWVALTESIFHAEFKRLKRNPSGSEFADAIEQAGHGRISDSTAKSIRTEILDRAPLPSLDTE